MRTGRLKERDDGAGAVPPRHQRAGLPDGPGRRSCRARGSPPAPPATPAGRSGPHRGRLGRGRLAGHNVLILRRRGDVSNLPYWKLDRAGFQGRETAPLRRSHATTDHDRQTSFDSESAFSAARRPVNTIKSSGQSLANSFPNTGYQQDPTRATGTRTRESKHLR